MRKLVPTVSLALVLALSLCLSLGACAKKADTQGAKEDQELVVTDEEAPADETEENAGDQQAEEADSEGEAAVSPVTRAQGPLAVVTDDELCSILVTGKGYDENGYQYGIEVSNNSAESISVKVAGDTLTVADTPAAASLTCEVAPEATEEPVLSLSFSDALPDAAAFEGVRVSGELQVLDGAGTVLATYPLAIN